MVDEEYSGLVQSKHPTRVKAGLLLIGAVAISLVMGIVIGLGLGYFLRSPCENDSSPISIDGMLLKLNFKGEKIVK